MAEETKIEETPTLKEETPKETDKPKTEAEELLAELEKVGIDDTTKLQGTVRASREAGNLANLVGELRAEINQLKQSRANVPTQQQDSFESETGAGQDLGQMINSILDNRERTKAEQQGRAQKLMLDQYQEIKSDKFYPQVKDIWNEKLKDPEFVFEIQSGMVNPLREYDKVVREYLVGVTKRSADTIKTMQTGKPLAPHLETGEARVPSVPGSTEDDKKPKTKALREKVKTGHLPTEQEQLEAIGEMLETP